jgi:SAM-dependent methyltransferase
MKKSMHKDNDNTTQMFDSFVEEYNSNDAILKYSKHTAGYGINYLLQKDYATKYLKVIKSNGFLLKGSGLRLLEFGCGAGMNLINLVRILRRQGIEVEKAYGTDFSSILIEAARRDAKESLLPEDLDRVRFYVAQNETLLDDLSAASGKADPELLETFDLILGVNTFRYCHRLGKSRECATDMFRLLRRGGVCIMIDMNQRFPLFRSRLRWSVEDPAECYLPSLDEYTTPFAQVGFEILEKDNFCWIPHSAGPALVFLCQALSPVLNLMARRFAMRSLVVSRKPILKG